MKIQNKKNIIIEKEKNNIANSEVEYININETKKVFIQKVANLNIKSDRNTYKNNKNNNIKKLENNQDKEKDIGNLIIETTESFILEIQKNQYNYKNDEDIKHITGIIVKENKLFKDIIYEKKKPNLYIPNDYPIYPYDQDDPEGFYSNI